MPQNVRLCAAMTLLASEPRISVHDFLTLSESCREFRDAIWRNANFWKRLAVREFPFDVRRRPWKELRSALVDWAACSPERTRSEALKTLLRAESIVHKRGFECAKLLYARLSDQLVGLIKTEGPVFPTVERPDSFADCLLKAISRRYVTRYDLKHAASERNNLVQTEEGSISILRPLGVTKVHFKQKQRYYSNGDCVTTLRWLNDGEPIFKTSGNSNRMGNKLFVRRFVEFLDDLFWFTPHQRSRCDASPWLSDHSVDRDEDFQISDGGFVDVPTDCLLPQSEDANSNDRNRSQEWDSLVKRENVSLGECAQLLEKAFCPNMWLAEEIENLSSFEPKKIVFPRKDE